MQRMLNDHWQSIDALITLALAEDIGSGDVSAAFVPEDVQIKAQFVAREALVVCGLPVVARVLAKRPGMAGFTSYANEGDAIGAGAVIAEVAGNARTVLTLERTMLNFMQRMSGVATLTRQYVDAVAHTKAKILDTRKTIPGWRVLDKYAVHTGGGVNHRMGLYDAVMVKDNHISAVGGRWSVVSDLRKTTTLPIIVECDTLEQVAEAATLPITRIVLDNMPLDMLREAVRLVAGRLPLEASGGVNLETVAAIAKTGVDFISVGALTHSARAVDIGLDIEY
jgi:nicotinate-nucleotide pyrophosphorylase (carboxylating)